jgi:hypothetical protein
MFDTFTAVLMLIVFLVPGFVWRTVEGQLTYLDRRLEWEKFALGLLCRSSFTYLPFAPWLYQGYKNGFQDDRPIATGAIALIFILVLPAILGFLSGLIRQKGCGRKLLRRLHLDTFEQHGVPTAWDRMFSDMTEKWIIVTLKNSGKVYGYFGSRSYASSEPEERDLFISHTVQMTNAGFEFVKETQGIYVRGEEISSIEFLEPQNTMDTEDHD